MVFARDLAWHKYDLMCKSSVAYHFARYALSLNYESLPQEVIHEAKRALLDTLGVAIGAYSRSPGRPVCEDVVQDLGGKEEATLFGSGRRTSVLNAALVNSFLVRFQDYNDVSEGRHGSDAVASILAACEREKAGGRDFLTSLVISYELGSRASNYGMDRSRENSPTAPAQGRGVALQDSRASLCMPPALGKVLGLNEDQIANAIGICASHSFALVVIMREEPSMSKNLRFGWIAHDALLSCILAKHGFTGPIRVYESDGGLTGLGRAINSLLQLDPERILDFSGWRILDNRYKFYRGCAGLQGQIQATITIVKENDLKPEDIASVRIKSGMANFANLLYKYPRVSEAADHSPYYTTAVAIKERNVGLDSYDPKKFIDPIIVDLIDKTVIEPPDPNTPMRAIAEITTKDGRHFEKIVDNPHGLRNDPLSDKELENKFKEMAAKCMSKSHIQKIFNTVWNLEKLNDISRLSAMMVWEPK